MAKVLIISTVNIKHMTGASFYYNFLASRNISFDIICVDKYGTPEKKPEGTENLYQFYLNFKPKSGKLKKISRYLTFRRYASRIIKQKEYTKIIVWGTETAILFSSFLTTWKYIINIRDYANSDKPIINSILKKKIKDSYLTTISSSGFKRFLPPHDYYLLNSFDKKFLEKKNEKMFSKNIPIKISFIGSVRFFDIDKKILNIFANDTRFRVQYFGVGSEKLKNYAEKNSIINVKFYGSFNPEETPLFIQDTDIINNLYGFNNISLDTATSLKYFFSIYFKKPILVFEGTHMESLVKNIGYSVPRNISDSLPDDIYRWYTNLDFKKFENEVNQKIKQIENENENLQNKILDWLREN